MSLREVIARNLSDIQLRMANAARRVGREPSAVRLVAVTKYAQLEWVRELVNLGQKDLGESRPQQLAERSREFGPNVRWHLIGHLQRNKVEIILPRATLIHSVDSWRLLDALQKEAVKLQARARALIEINVSGEASKDGFQIDELRKNSRKLLEYSHIEIAGLMTMAPQSDDPDDARPVFRALHDFRNELTTLTDGGLNIPHLSMGMSGDFEVAIEEGSTLVRIGSSLFAGCEEAEIVRP